MAERWKYRRGLRHDPAFMAAFPMPPQCPLCERSWAAEQAMVPLSVRAPWLTPQVRSAVTDSSDVTPVPVPPAASLTPAAPPQDPARPCACGCGELVVSGAMTGRPRLYVSHAHRMRAQRRRSRAASPRP